MSLTSSSSSATALNQACAFSCSCSLVVEAHVLLLLARQGFQQSRAKCPIKSQL